MSPEYTAIKFILFDIVPKIIAIGSAMGRGKDAENTANEAIRKAITDNSTPEELMQSLDSLAKYTKGTRDDALAAGDSLQEDNPGTGPSTDEGEPGAGQPAWNIGD